MCIVFPELSQAMYLHFKPYYLLSWLVQCCSKLAEITGYLQKGSDSIALSSQCIRISFKQSIANVTWVVCLSAFLGIEMLYLSNTGRLFWCRRKHLTRIPSSLLQRLGMICQCFPPAFKNASQIYFQILI